MITIETIPHKSHRYETVGDYYDDAQGNTRIFVSDMGNQDYEFLVGLHELIEQYLCKNRGIKETDISAFDIQFEKNRAEGNKDEPGDDPLAPYQNEHLIATGIEFIVAAALNVKIDEYDKALNAL